MIEKNDFKASRVVKVVSEILLYSIIGIIAVIIFDLPIELTGKLIVENIFAPFFSTYWFATAYLIMYLFSPFFNRILKDVDDSTIRKFLILLTLVIPLYTSCWDLSISSDILLVCYIYILVYYLKKKDKNVFSRFKQKGILVTYVLTLFLMTLSAYLGVGIFAGFLTRRYSLINIIISLFLFYTFKDIKIPYNKTINFFAKGVFAVYLLQENGVYYDYLKIYVFKFYEMFLTPMFVPYLLVVTLCVVFACTILDVIRRIFLEPPFTKFTDIAFRSVYRYIDNSINEMT